MPFVEILKRFIGFYQSQQINAGSLGAELQKHRVNLGKLSGKIQGITLTGGEKQ